MTSITITPKEDFKGLIAGNQYAAMDDGSNFYYLILVGQYLHKDYFNTP